MKYMNSQTNVDFVKQLAEDVGSWLAKSPSSDDATDDALTLAPVNGFLRALTYQTLERTDFGSAPGEGPGFVAATVRENGGPPRIRLTRATPESAPASVDSVAARAMRSTAARSIASADVGASIARRSAGRAGREPRVHRRGRRRAARPSRTAARAGRPDLGRRGSPPRGGPSGISECE